MKRFLSFLLFVLALSITVGALQYWKARRDGVPMRGPLSRFFEEDPGHRHPEKYTIAEGPSINLKDVDVLAAMSRQRILLAKAVVPSVVSITTTKSVEQSRQQGNSLFRLYHQGMEMPVPKEKGSGVIVSKEGHIVTNNHVIEGMDEIEVELSDGRLKRARLIGTDVSSDIAVLKIEAGDVRPIPFGDSELVEVGETVMAVGNPYGLEESVSQGIISAKGRKNETETLNDLLQTDAAINPGNSGGPLINVRGELIGINEAIFSQSGGWQGVGFAIPSVTVRRTMDSILKIGRVMHGYLGVNLQPVEPANAREFGLPDSNGALVADVMPGSPAAMAKIQRGDFIKKFNNQAISNIQGLRRAVAEVDINASAPVELMREGKPLTVQATIAEKPPETQISQAPPLSHQFLPPNSDGSGTNDIDGDNNLPIGNLLTGVQALDLNPMLIRRLKLPSDLQGVIVQDVFSDSPAAESLRTGDVIESVNRQPVASLSNYRQMAAHLPVGEPVLLSVLRSGARLTVVIKAE